MSPSWPEDVVTRWSRWALRLTGLLVPSGRRRDWLDEWEAELWQLRTHPRGRADLGLFLTGAVWHGTWEWKEGLGMDSLLQDTKVAARTLVRSPGFAGVAVVMLALAIGANTALFSVIEEAVLAQPPFAQAEQLVVVDQLFAPEGHELAPSVWSYPRYMALRAEVGSVDPMAGYALRTMVLTELGSPTLVSVESVTPSLFPLLGVEPELGRVFGPGEEDDGGADMVALVSHAFWRGRLGGAPDVVGSTLTLDRLRFQVLGVLPEGFDGVTGGAEVWIPLSALREVENPTLLEDPWNQYFFVVGRLAQGVTLAAARAEVRAFGVTVMERFPPPPAAARVRSSADVVPFAQARVNPVAMKSMMALFGAVGLVLLIAVANLAGIMLARGVARRREAAIRASLGAGAGRLMRQLLTESLILAAVGGLLGVGIAWVGIDALGSWLGDALGTGGGRSLQYFDADALSIDWRVLGYALLLTTGVGVGFGLLPAWQAARTDPSDAFRAARSPGGSLHAGVQGMLGRNGLIVLQVAVAVILLGGASLMMQSLMDLQRTDSGYDQDNLLTATYSLSVADREAGMDPGVFHIDFLERVRGLPGVTGATLGEVPMGGPTWRTVVLGSEGRPDLTPADHHWIRLQTVADGHMSVMGARIVEGRDIEATDDRNSEKVILLSRTAADELFPDGNAVGRRISLGPAGWASPGPVVVGIVEGLLLDGPAQPMEPQGYIPVRQAPRLATGVLVRTSGDPEALAPALEATLAEIGPDVVLTSVMSMEARARSTAARPRMVTLLLSLFGTVSLLLVAAGLYGSIAFAVARRTKELGLRASLGASRSTILMLVLRQGLGITLVGIALGLVGWNWGAQFLEGVLVGAGRANAVSLFSVSVILLVVALAAALVPARRALRIDPMSALRSE